MVGDATPRRESRSPAARLCRQRDPARCPAGHHRRLFRRRPSAAARAVSGNLSGPGHQSEMRALYAAAICVVTPSRAASFSLPVVEATAAQAPAVVSDIPAHRALITDPALRFAPNDADRLATILERLVQDNSYRASVVSAAMARLAAIFRRGGGAQSLVRADTGPAGAAPQMSKPRLAMITPLPPAKSGVADYSAALAKTLAGTRGAHLVHRRECEGQRPAEPQLRPGDQRDRQLHAAYRHLQSCAEMGHAAICHDAQAARPDRGTSAWSMPPTSPAPK